MPLSNPQPARPLSKKKRFVLVGTGGRSCMFSDPIIQNFAESAELAALCDVSQVRMDYQSERLQREYGSPALPTYLAHDFDRMLDEIRPDTVIVCTVDALHAEYITRSVARGCDVICEKPIATEAAQCRAILAAVQSSGRSVRVTFNVRWVPGIRQIRRMVEAGEIGNVKHVNLEYMLSTSHGADYFRRWHSEKAQSGGLLVHKSTHHFDIVNWILNVVPKTIFADGGLVYYGRNNAVSRGEEVLTKYERYTGHANAGDPFRLDLNTNESSRGLYLDAESETGYIRDRNVFREGITIEDSMSVLVRYQNGTLLNYSLNAYCPYEGYRLHLTGDRGRIEFEERHGAHEILGPAGAEPSEGTAWKRLRFFPLFGREREIPVEEGVGGHGGGDPLLQEQMFAASPPDDPLGRNAGHEQGIASAMIGIAANESMRTGLPVNIGDLLGSELASSKLSDLV